ncbi:hypothetical protein F2P81_001780 [Scophthalmus maximus]|uniref:Uncharacterized protein n=1 Tax=Scophthalmus maximus TaxID=52904 RepID=A0A6A4TR63_SCOMX|nr:hypothetical protein F2P81_001780 [Scophthalmus maximus]
MPKVNADKRICKKKKKDSKSSFLFSGKTLAVCGEVERVPHGNLNMCHGPGLVYQDFSSGAIRKSQLSYHTLSSVAGMGPVLSRLTGHLNLVVWSGYLLLWQAKTAKQLRQEKGSVVNWKKSAN